MLRPPTAIAILAKRRNLATSGVIQTIQVNQGATRALVNNSGVVDVGAEGFAAAQSEISRFRALLQSQTALRAFRALAGSAGSHRGARFCR